MKNHVNTICKSAYISLKKIGTIRRILTTKATKTLVHALITSKLDIGNGLLYGIPSSLLNKIQKVQNSAARLISQSSRRDHITPILHELHWLPVHQRVKFKILTVTYKGLHNMAPPYITRMVVPYVPPRVLRSDSGLALVNPKTKLKSFGDRGFYSSAPRLWNRLPNHIRTAASLSSFKSRLKHHLFQETYC